MSVPVSAPGLLQETARGLTLCSFAAIAQLCPAVCLCSPCLCHMVSLHQPVSKAGDVCGDMPHPTVAVLMELRQVCIDGWSNAVIGYSAELHAMPGHVVSQGFRRTCAEPLRELQVAHASQFTSDEHGVECCRCCCFSLLLPSCREAVAGTSSRPIAGSQLKVASKQHAQGLCEAGC